MTIRESMEDVYKRQTDWLKGILAYTLVGTLTNACPFEEIQTNQMSDPSQEKLLYYEQYYQKTKRLSHAIVVDEKMCIRDRDSAAESDCSAGRDFCPADSGNYYRRSDFRLPQLY